MVEATGGKEKNIVAVVAFYEMRWNDVARALCLWILVLRATYVSLLGKILKILLSCYFYSFSVAPLAEL